MGGGGKSGGGSSFDPVEAAQAQAQYNRLNVFTPQGNVIFGQMGPNGAFIPDYLPEGANIPGGFPIATGGATAPPAGIQFGANGMIGGYGYSGGSGGGGTGELPFNILNRTPDGGAKVSGGTGDGIKGGLPRYITEGELQRYQQAAVGPGTVPFGFRDRDDPLTSASVFVQETPFQLQQRIQREAIALNLGNELGQQEIAERPDPIDYSALPAVDQFSQENIDAVRDATYNRAFNLLDPELQRQERSIEQRLADRGLPIGSEAFADEYNRFEDSRARQLNDLSMASVLAGSDERMRQLQEQMTLRNQAMAEAEMQFQQLTSRRANQINEMASLLGRDQINPSLPNPSVPQVDIAGMMQQSAAMDAQAQQGSKGGFNSLLGAAGSIVGSRIPL